MATLKGPDVSAYQQKVDWQAVAGSGASFGIARASLGVGDPDPTFAANWAGMKAAGLIRGAYHYAYPLLGNQPDAEAEAFLSQISDLQSGDFLVLDIEDITSPPRAQPDLNVWCLEWLQHVQAKTQIVPWVYTGSWYALGKLSDPALAGYPLWDAAYTINPPVAYAPWSTITLWQHTDQASYPGINGACDESWFFGSVEQLLGIIKQSGSGPTLPDDAYVVRAGDTMSSIAAAQHVSLAALEAANPQISDPNQIYPGEILHIPGASATGPRPGRLIAACALKTEPNHTSPALVDAPAGGTIMVLPWQARTNGVIWQRVRWTDKEGWVLLSNVSMTQG